MNKDEYKKYSKQRLQKIVETKIKTTMIGALSVIEKVLEDYPEIFDTVYNNVRKEILDKGNTQIRNMETELEQYEVNWLRYQLKLPIKPKQPE